MWVCGVCARCWCGECARCGCVVSVLDVGMELMSVVMCGHD